MLPEKAKIWYRYDPPVLIVAITWHATQTLFGRFLHERLALNYFNTAQLVWISLPSGLCTPDLFAS